jgi:hypothetical protein
MEPLSSLRVLFSLCDTTTLTTTQLLWLQLAYQTASRYTQGHRDTRVLLNQINRPGPCVFVGATTRRKRIAITYSKHRLFLFLQLKQAICVLLLLDASSSWFRFNTPTVGDCGAFDSIVLHVCRMMHMVAQDCAKPRLLLGCGVCLRLRPRFGLRDVRSTRFAHGLTWYTTNYIRRCPFPICQWFVDEVFVVAIQLTNFFLPKVFHSVQKPLASNIHQCTFIEL